MSDPARRVLVLAPNWLGDAVMALPAIADIRRAFPSGAADRRRAPRGRRSLPARPIRRRDRDAAVERTLVAARGAWRPMPRGCASRRGPGDPAAELVRERMAGHACRRRGAMGLCGRHASARCCRARSSAGGQHAPGRLLPASDARARHRERTAGAGVTVPEVVSRPRARCSSGADGMRRRRSSSLRRARRTGRRSAGFRGTSRTWPRCCAQRAARPVCSSAAAETHRPTRGSQVLESASTRGSLAAARHRPHGETHDLEQLGAASLGSRRRCVSNDSGAMHLAARRRERPRRAPLFGPTATSDRDGAAHAITDGTLIGDVPDPSILRLVPAVHASRVSGSTTGA